MTADEALQCLADWKEHGLDTGRWGGVTPFSMSAITDNFTQFELIVLDDAGNELATFNSVRQYQSESPHYAWLRRASKTEVRP
jgi:hypothetical protein